MQSEASTQLNSSLNLSEASIRHEEDHDAPSTNPTLLVKDSMSTLRGAPSIMLPHQPARLVRHFALDIGGSLIKLIFFAVDADTANTDVGGRLHFVKFETRHLEQCLDFIETHVSVHEGKQLLHVKATGGGAHKFAERVFTRLGLLLDTVDEMRALVDGCCFLTKTIRNEVFTYEHGQTTFVPVTQDSDVFPFLLVNIGSGVSMIKVEADGSYQRVSGSSLGGGTFWGLARLLTGAKDFDEILTLCAEGDNGTVDMLVGDIYGGNYSAVGLSATTIASSFGKVVGGGLSLADVKPADAALAALRMISYNIGQLAYLNAQKYGLQRIIFGGFFLRGHPFTMETISFAIRFWSQGTMAAMFCKHEGFLGAIGAFLQVHPIDATVTPPTTTSTTTTTTPAVTHVSPPHTPSPEPTAPFDGAPTLQGGSTWPAVEEHQVGDNTPAQDPVAALECGWSQAAQGIDDFAGAIGGVLEKELRLEVSREWSESFRRDAVEAREDQGARG